jgi:fused signal recognition particle receptor
MNMEINIQQIVGSLFIILFFGFIILAVIKFARKKKEDALPEEKEEEEKTEIAGMEDSETEEPLPEQAEIIEGATISQGLVKTRKEGFVSRLFDLIRGKTLDENQIERIEEILFTSDIGVRTSQKLINALKEGLSRKELSDEEKVFERLKKEMRDIFPGSEGGFAESLFLNNPAVIMIAGVNGSGKTTTIGKLANMLVQQGKSVLLVAGDTFRAAAADQLRIWAQRAGTDIVEGRDEQDPGSVVFEGIKKAVEEKYDAVIVDTAGRLHTRTNLLEELKKIKRVISKVIASAPHEILLVLDATTGQNGLKQAEVFLEATQVTGIALAKLDGTAKGGIVMGIYDELKIPVKFVGVGEKIEDIRPFDADEYVEALFA